MPPHQIVPEPIGAPVAETDGEIEKSKRNGCARISNISPVSSLDR